MLLARARPRNDFPSSGAMLGVIPSLERCRFWACPSGRLNEGAAVAQMWPRADSPAPHFLPNKAPSPGGGFDWGSPPAAPAEV